MLDIRFIREQPDLVQAGARKKHIDVDIRHLLEVDEQRRRLLGRVEELKAQRNRMSKEIATLEGESRQTAIAAMKEVAAESKGLESSLRDAQAVYEALMLRVPNVPADEVPEGETDADNVVVKTWGELPQFDFTPLDHVELGERLDIIDIPRAVKLAGARTYFLKNAGALLEQAVLQFALHHMVHKGFAPFLVPHLVKDDPMVGTAYFPVGQEQTYRLQEDGLNLIGTAEVPLTAYHANEILAEQGPSELFRRTVELLSPRGRHLRQGHPRAIPHPPVSEGGAGGAVRQ